MSFAPVTENGASAPAWERTVLIIDGNRVSAEAMADALSLSDYRVEWAQSADAALSALERFLPAAFLVDVRLGELIPQIKARLPDAVCIIVTASPNIDTAIEALHLKADDYLQKPLPPEEIGKILDNYLEGKGPKNGAESVKFADRDGLCHPRDNSFGRVLVHRFSHLFFDPATAPDHRDPIPRRVLPGFFAAVDMMLGADRVERNQQICHEAIIEISKRESSAGAKAWAAFYADEKVNEVAVETEMLMAAHFRNFDRRAEWLTNVIVNNGSLENRHTDSQTTSWPPSEKALMTMLSALFSDLRTEISDERKQRQIATKFGKEESQLFANVVEEVQRRSANG